MNISSVFSFALAENSDFFVKYSEDVLVIKFGNAFKLKIEQPGSYLSSDDENIVLIKIEKKNILLNIHTSSSFDCIFEPYHFCIHYINNTQHSNYIS
jgi:hypothetical protein